MEIVHNHLVHDATLADRTLLTPVEISNLLEFCLTATYLAYKGEIFQQMFDTAMGSPVSVTVADLVMDDVEEQAISFPPLFWKRFVDDVCTSIPSECIKYF